MKKNRLFQRRNDPPAATKRATSATSRSNATARPVSPRSRRHSISSSVQSADHSESSDEDPSSRSNSVASSDSRHSSRSHSSASDGSSNAGSHPHNRINANTTTTHRTTHSARPTSTPSGAAASHSTQNTSSRSLWRQRSELGSSGPGHSLPRTSSSSSSSSSNGSNSNSRVVQSSSRKSRSPTVGEQEDFFDAEYHELHRMLSNEDEFDDSEEDMDGTQLLSIRAEPIDLKRKGARQRWAQQAKLKATNFLENTKSTGKFAAQAAAHAAATIPIKRREEKMSILNKWYQTKINNVGRALQIGRPILWGLREEGNVMEDVDAKSIISLEEVISTPKMIRYYVAWLEEQNQGKVFFLCSLDEFRHLWMQLFSRRHKDGLKDSTAAQISKREDIRRRLVAQGNAIINKYLEEGHFKVGSEILKRDELKYIKNVMQSYVQSENERSKRSSTRSSPPKKGKSNSSSRQKEADMENWIDSGLVHLNLLHLFDRIELRVKKELKARFPAFREDEMYTEMLSSVKREVYPLDDILLNHRFSKYYWIFLFQHNYHREMALWLEIEYTLKPVYLQLLGQRKSITGSIVAVEEHENSSFLAHKEAGLKSLFTYIKMKYFAGDEEMENLGDDTLASFRVLLREQANIVDKLREVHTELYPRFMGSKSYVEFAYYSKLEDHMERNGMRDSIDYSSTSFSLLDSSKYENLRTMSPETKDFYRDENRLSILLRNYGLRAHLWPEDPDPFSRNNHSLQYLRENKGKGAVKYVLTFESTRNVSANRVETSFKSHNVDSADDGTTLGRSARGNNVKRSAGSEDDNSVLTMISNIRDFLLPMVEGVESIVTSHICPPPVAFNTHVGDGPTELFGACMVVYRPVPQISSQRQKENYSRREVNGHNSTHSSTNSTTGAEIPENNWMPYGVCLLSSYPLLDTLRTRLSDHFQKCDSQKPWKLTPSQLKDLCRPAVVPQSVALSDQFSFPSCSGRDNSVVRLPAMEFSLQLLFETLDLRTLVTTFTAILLECRILFLSSYYTVLARIAESFRTLTYPLTWPHVYIPILPAKMVEYLQCPTPFIFGIHKDIFTRYNMTGEIDEEVLIIDLDRSRIVQGDVPIQLPAKVEKELYGAFYACLKPSVTKSDSIMYNASLTRPEAFPNNQVRSVFYELTMEILGNFGYYRYLWDDSVPSTGGNDLGRSSQKSSNLVIFDEASYLASSTAPYRAFRASFIATQAFSEFLVKNNGFVANRDEPAMEKPVGETSKQRKRMMYL